MSKQRLDQYLFVTGQAQSRSQATNLIKLGRVSVDGNIASKAHAMVGDDNTVTIAGEKYVSRAGNKLASVARKLGVAFGGATVLDVGSSTGGFTDYALQNGAQKVFAVDVGTDQLHPSLRGSERVELHEKTDIRNFTTSESIDIVVIDVSFISLRDVLPHIATLCSPSTQIIAMVKPQFEAGEKQKNKGVVKNDRMRREILKDFESWARQRFLIADKADSEVSGQKGNVERFYALSPLKQR